MPLDQAEAPGPRFSAEEMRRRHQRARALMRERAVQALLVGGGPGSPDVFYLAHYRLSSPAWVVPPAGGEPVVPHHFFNRNACARAMATVADVRWYGPSAAQAVAACLREVGLAGWRGGGRRGGRREWLHRYPLRFAVRG
jgi:hypothetical protein